MPIPGLNRAAIQAINVARSIDDDVRAVYISDDPDEARQGPGGIRAAGARASRSSSSSRRTGRSTGPLLAYLDVLDQAWPPDKPEPITFVVIPEYVARSWWERMLYNQSAKHLRRVLLGRPHTVVVNVPYQREAPTDQPDAEASNDGPDAVGRGPAAARVLAAATSARAGRGTRRSRRSGARGCSMPIMCATSGQTSARAFGALVSRWRAVTATSDTSSSPATARIGQRSSARRSLAGGARRIGLPWGLRRIPTVHLEDQVADGRRDAGRRLTRTVDPDLDVDLGDGRRVHRVLRLESLHLLEHFELFGRVPAIEAAEPGANADDRDYPVRRLDRGVEGEHATHRVADEDGAVDALASSTASRSAILENSTSSVVVWPAPRWSYRIVR